MHWVAEIWANRSLLPEAARTRPRKFLIINFRQQWTSSIETVCFRWDHWGLFRNASAFASLRKFSSYGTTISPRLDHQSPLGTPTILHLEVFHHSQGVRYTGVSQRHSGSSSCGGHGTCYPRTTATRRRPTQQGAGSGGMPPAVPLWRPGPIKCLRWHDSSPQKCPELQHSFEWHGHATGMVIGFAIAVQWDSCSEWTSQAIITPAEENRASHAV